MRNGDLFRPLVLKHGWWVIGLAVLPYFAARATAHLLGLALILYATDAPHTWELVEEPMAAETPEVTRSVQMTVESSEASRARFEEQERREMQMVEDYLAQQETDDDPPWRCKLPPGGEPDPRVQRERERLLVHYPGIFGEDCRRETPPFGCGGCIGRGTCPEPKYINGIRVNEFGLPWPEEDHVVAPKHRDSRVYARVVPQPIESVSGGGLHPEIIKRVMRRNRRDLASCYAPELKKKKTLEGEVTVNFTISEAGAVVAASTEASTLKNRKVERCVTKKVRRWVFPEPKDGEMVMVRYPLQFSAGY